jgi:D-alanyl-D-alanine dipeptidase
LPRPERAALHLVFSILIAALVSTGAVADPARHPRFVNADDVVAGLKLDIRYFGDHNFVGNRIDGYEAPVCLLTREAANALDAVQRDLATHGLGLKVFDCYRPVRAVAHFVRWARDIPDQARKAKFYPEADKRDLFKDGYISARSGHSRGSTVDLTLVRPGGGDVDMGTPFDFFSARSWTTDRSISSEAQANRRTLASAMARRGFRPYAKEWWHFTLNAEPFPETYFDFPVR